MLLNTEKVFREIPEEDQDKELIKRIETLQSTA